MTRDVKIQFPWDSEPIAPADGVTVRLVSNRDGARGFFCWGDDTQAPMPPGTCVFVDGRLLIQEPESP